MYYIGYDIGSSSVKVALVDEKTKKSIAVVSEPKNENVYRLNESNIRRLIRNSIRRQLR